MKRFFYALRLWAWFATRENARAESFHWFLKAYDQRESNYRGEF